MPVVFFVSVGSLGAEAVEHYTPRPTEWPDGTRSDVLYAADEKAFPPVLAEVQNVVNDEFMHRLVLYSEAVFKQYRSSPVVLILAIKDITDSVNRQASKDKTHAFLYRLSSFPWAKKCLLLNYDSIHSHMASIPLDPWVLIRTPPSPTVYVFGTPALYF